MGFVRALSCLSSQAGGDSAIIPAKHFTWRQPLPFPIQVSGFFLLRCSAFPSAFQLEKLTLTCPNTAVSPGSCQTHGAHLRTGYAGGYGEHPAGTRTRVGAGEPKRGWVITSPREGEEPGDGEQGSAPRPAVPAGPRRLPFPWRTTRWLRAGWPGARWNPGGCAGWGNKSVFPVLSHFKGACSSAGLPEDGRAPPADLKAVLGKERGSPSCPAKI